MVQYIEHIFQQFISVKFIAVLRCIGKKWLFGFCEGSACVSGKTKCAICEVPFVSVSFSSVVRSNRLAPNVWQLPDGGEKAAQQMQFNKLNRELQAYIYRSTATIG
jgi:hypothetical protein